jgi:hypothetical protein
MTGHVFDEYSSKDVYDVLEKYSNGDKGPCKQLVVGYCPLAKKPFDGSPNPHFKAMCRISGDTPQSGRWIVGIFGELGKDTFVTGFVTSYKYLEGTIKRDQCVKSDLTALLRFFR